MVSGDESARKGTQLCVTEESYINKESEKQLRSRYDHLFLLNMLQLAGLSAKFTAVGYHPGGKSKNTPGCICPMLQK